MLSKEAELKSADDLGEHAMVELTAMAIDDVSGAAIDFCPAPRRPWWWPWFLA